MILVASATMSVSLVACSELGVGNESGGATKPAPSVSIQRPADGSRYVLGATVPLEVATAGSEGRVLTVSVTADGSETSVATFERENGVYEGSFVPDAVGAHAIVAFVADEMQRTVRTETTVHVDATEPEPEPSISIDPEEVSLEPGASIEVTATVAGVDDTGVHWEASGGSITGDGATITYAAPSLIGEYAVTATSEADAALRASLDVRVTEKRFSVVVLPDTQNMTRPDSGGMVDDMIRWIVDSAEELDLGFVTHVGDVVGSADDLEEWGRAVPALSRLDGVVPYSVALGDHEYEIEENMGSSIENYLEFFGPQRYAHYPWYGGSSESGKNHYQIFDAGGRRFLHVTLEWEAPGPASDPDTPLGWARGVLEEHPQLPTIITTHAYLWDYPDERYIGRTWREHHLEGYVEQDDGTTVFPGSTGQDIFEALVEPYPQVFMVLNGHYHKQPDGTTQGEWHQVSTNDAGLDVYEMLSNYQSYPNGGNGWLRTIEFLPGGGADDLDRIAVSTYSPVLDAYQTDELSEFHFDVSFEERFAPH